jgi:hypothetical protein
MELINTNKITYIKAFHLTAYRGATLAAGAK